MTRPLPGNDGVLGATGASLVVDDTALTLALASYGIGSLVIALNVPWIVDRFGVTRPMLVGGTLIVLGLIAAALITGLLTSDPAGWPLLLATWVALGMGTSLVNTPSSRLLAEASTPQNRNLVYTAQFALSHACFLITYPIAEWLGGTSLLAAAVTLAILASGALATAFLHAENPHRRRDAAETATDPTGEAAPAPETPAETT